jgi:hypothetical protein
MLFDVVADPHEQHDLAAEQPALVAEGRELLASWTSDQLARSFSPVDPMDVVMAEGGPFHCRGELPAYLDRLRATGRAAWADHLADRHLHPSVSVHRSVGLATGASTALG